LEQALPDFIFLDINMPRLNGFNCLRELKERNALHDVAVVIYSSDIPEETSKKAIGMGAAFCVEKTAAIGTLSKKLQAILTTNKSSHV
jgi:DNA-binding response OmpR family regulator